MNTKEKESLKIIERDNNPETEAINELEKVGILKSDGTTSPLKFGKGRQLQYRKKIVSGNVKVIQSIHTICHPRTLGLLRKSWKM